MARRKFLILIGFLLIAGIGFVNDLYLATPPLRGAIAGQNLLPETQRKPAPDFAFTGMDGAPRRLRDFAGREVLLHFWASWCAPCIEEFPSLLDYVSQRRGAVILIALSSDKDAAAMRGFVNRLPEAAQQAARLPFIHIALDKNRAVTRDLFFTENYPETIFIDAQQRMAGKVVGAITWRRKTGQRISDDEI